MNLCNENFQKFFDSLQGAVSDRKEIEKRIQSALPYVTDELQLGKLELQLCTASNPCETTEYSVSCELYVYQEGYQETAPYTQKFDMDGKIQCSMTAYPRCSHTFTQTELTILRFLMETIFLFYGNSHLLEMLDNYITIDCITGAANMIGLRQFTEILTQKHLFHTYTGIFLNLKNFKYINRMLEIPEGDKLLKAYSSYIHKSLDEDEILVRPGSDNFFVLIKDSHVTSFLDLLSDIHLSAQTLYGQKEFHIMARAGIYPIQPTDTIRNVLDGSNAALLLAKQSGSQDYIWFEPYMLERSIQSREISNEFELSLKNEEFVVYYQPKADFSDNTLCGCEALCRWMHNGTLISPDDFIPTLEKDGSICVLDFYVFDKVCADIRQWLNQGIEPVRVSVNFSKLHLRNPHLAKDIWATMKKNDIDSRFIEIELTEMSQYTDYQALISFINHMKDLGINTSIDDFGTGYSSLNMLKDLNVDIIKLDKSFLNNIQNKSDTIVIRNIVNMVSELNMKIIAEGVETMEQADFLKNINCHMAQGFLFDKPLCHEEFEQRLLHKRAY